ncbi:MAG: hypothetical protein Q9183_005561, partial [Haloplaca sp. 2 TL-2023]
NFTVAQTRFDESALPDIVPIPWNATEASDAGTGLSREATIGISTGLAVFALLTILLIVFFTLRWRRRRAVKVAVDTRSAHDDPQEKDPEEILELPHFERCEMSHQAVPELHDVGFCPEILNENTPSGSDNVMNEMPEDAKTQRHELIGMTTKTMETRPSSSQTSSKSPAQYFELEVSGQSFNQSPLMAASSPSRTPFRLSNPSSTVSETPSTHPQSESQHRSLSSTSPNRTPRTAPTSPITSPINPNIHKELPHEPITADWRTGTSPSSRSSSSLLSPGGHHKFQMAPSTDRHVGMAVRPQMPTRSTHTTASGEEEYQRGHYTNEELNGSF